MDGDYYGHMYTMRTGMATRVNERVSYNIMAISADDVRSMTMVRLSWSGSELKNVSNFKLDENTFVHNIQGACKGVPIPEGNLRMHHRRTL